jgi:hypothetical protein
MSDKPMVTGVTVRFREPSMDAPAQTTIEVGLNASEFLGLAVTVRHDQAGVLTVNNLASAFRALADMIEQGR